MSDYDNQLEFIDTLPKVKKTKQTNLMSSFYIPDTLICLTFPWLPHYFEIQP